MIPLFTNMAPFKFTDPLAGQFPGRFYRAVPGADRGAWRAGLSLVWDTLESFGKRPYLLGE